DDAAVGVESVLRRHIGLGNVLGATVVRDRLRQPAGRVIHVVLVDARGAGAWVGGADGWHAATKTAGDWAVGVRQVVEDVVRHGREYVSRCTRRAVARVRDR